jgi:hypothetical protein
MEILAREQSWATLMIYLNLPRTDIAGHPLRWDIDPKEYQSLLWRNLKQPSIAMFRELPSLHWIPLYGRLGIMQQLAVVGRGQLSAIQPLV